MPEGRVVFVDRQGALAVWGVLTPMASALEAHGWETGFICMADDSGRAVSSDRPSLGVRVIDVPSKRWPGDLLRQQWAFEKGFSEVLCELRPDVVHVNFAIPGIWARRLAKRLGVPRVVATQHELRSSMSWHLRLGLWATRGCVDVHTYVSDTVAASFGMTDRLQAVDSGEGPPLHTVIRNSVDEAAISEAAASVKSRVPGRVVVPGRLVRVKGHHRILDAFAQVHNQHPEAELVIAGDGPEEAMLHRQVERLEIAGAVKFTGWLPQEELWALVASAQVAVFASDGTQEGFGLALAEAALLNTSLVTSDIAAFREVLAKDDQAAWWFQPTDTGGLAQALMQALSASPDERDRRVESARRAVKARATQRVMVEQYVQLYDRLAMSLASSAK